MIAKTKFALLFTVILIGLSTNGFSMGFFGLFAKKEEIVIFGGIQGRILLNGEPAAGAQIKLWTKWNSPEGNTLIVKTDENGRFELPEQTAQYRPSPFAQLVISHELKVNYKGETYPIWIASARTGYTEGMLGFQPKNFVCELTQEKAYFEREQVNLFSTCQWDDELKIQK